MSTETISSAKSNSMRPSPVGKLSIGPMLQFHRTLLRRTESRLLIWVLTLGLVALSAVQLLTLRLDRALVLEATQWVGADMVVASTQPIPIQWLQKAQNTGLTQSITTEFPSVVYTDTHMQLAAIKAVQTNYPLKGEIKTSQRPLASAQEWTTHTSGPPPGQVWVDQRILAALDIAVGQTLTLGEKPFTVTAVLQYEPDRHTNFLSLSPRVLMHWQDLPQTGVIQPGSRLQHRLLIASESAPEALPAFQRWLGKQLRAGDKIVTALDERPTLSRASERLKHFLSTSLWLTLAMTLTATALATQNLSHQMFPTLRTLYFLGMPPRRIKRWYAAGLMLVGLIALLIGACFGAGLQEIAAQSFALHLPPTVQTLSPPVVLSWINLAILIPLALGMMRFSQQLEALIQDTPTQPVTSLVKSGYAALFILLTGFLLLATVPSWQAGLVMLSGLLGALAIIYGLYHGLLILARRMLQGAIARYAILNLSRLSHLYFFQLLAFVVAIISGSIAWSMGGELLGQWQNQLPEGTPNIFSINLQPKDNAAFEKTLADAGIAPPTLYPVVRGRLTAINQTPLQQAATKEKDPRSQVNALERDLNFTWLSEPPKKNTVTAGHWWPYRSMDSASPMEVSVEQKIAERLEIALGDEITVTIGTQTLTATVTSLREVTWESFEPNFYFIFEPRALQAFNFTYMSSFYLTPEQSAILPKLARTFTSVTFFDVKALLAQGDRMLKNLSLAVWLFGGLTALIGAGILLTCHQQRQALWRQQGAVLFALGADTRWQKKVLRTETRLLWCLSFLIGWAAAEAIRLALNLQMALAVPSAFAPALGMTVGLMTLWWLLNRGPFDFTRGTDLEQTLRA